MGRKLSLDKKKLKALFRVMINSAPTPKYVAYGLGINKPETIKDWIKSGEILQEQFYDELEPLDDIYPYQFEEVFENRKLEFDAEFRRLYGLEPEGEIPDRNKFAYEQFMLKEKQVFIEDNIEYKEKNILSGITLVKNNEEQDEQFKLLIMFSRIYNRAKTIVEMGLLNSINKHAKTAKNVMLGYKLLQQYNKEDFGESQTINHTGTVEVNNHSILSMALSYERSQREALESKNDNVIEIENMKKIEQKED